MKKSLTRAAVILSPAERRAVASKAKTKRAEERRASVLERAERAALDLSKKVGRSVAVLGTKGHAVFETHGHKHAKKNPETLSAMTHGGGYAKADSLEALATALKSLPEYNGEHLRAVNEANEVRGWVWVDCNSKRPEWRMTS